MMSSPSSTCVEAALRVAAAQLLAVTDRPRLEAELLLAHLLDQPRISLHAHPEQLLTPTDAAAYRALIQRRLTQEPLPYITGRIEFYGRDFAVTPDVLIPRPETELLVETALAWEGFHDDLQVVDVGTGSGCIAVTLAAARPLLHVVATDLSSKALGVAGRNIHRHGVTGRVHCVQANLLKPLHGPFDLIVSNPPYVAREVWDALPASVRREPRLALLAGLQGLDVVRCLLHEAQARLRPGGLLLVEIGETQGAAVRAMARANFPRSRVRVLKDLAGKERLLRVDVW